MTRLERIVSWFPRGLRISEAEWDRRHRTVTMLLAVQIPVVFLFGLWRGFGVPHLGLELAVPVAAALVALAPRLVRRLRAAAVTAGIVWLSAALVHLSGGYIEAHFHFFIMLGFIALYQDWFPFGWAIGFVVVSHGFMTLWDPDSMFNHPAAQEQPFLWAGIHGAAVAFACVGQLTAWKAAEREADEQAEVREEAAAERRDAIARLYVDLSRRNGSLVENQLSVIDTLERTVEDPEVLGRLFELDHLTTRIRRNGESLLVVAGADPVVTRRTPMPMTDVARAAVSEVDQYARVDVRIEEEISIHGPVVRDLAHLLAELIENGTAFSPPSSRVVVDARVSDDGQVVVTVEDRGLGIEVESLAAANARLADPEELTVDATRHLGHHVVARLAAKHDVSVVLRPTDGGGITAVVRLPVALVHEPRPATDQSTDTAPPSSSPVESSTRDAAPTSVPPSHVPGATPSSDALALTPPASVPIDGETEEIVDLSAGEEELLAADGHELDGWVAVDATADADPVDDGPSVADETSGTPTAAAEHDLVVEDDQDAPTDADAVAATPADDADAGDHEPTDEESAPTLPWADDPATLDRPSGPPPPPPAGGGQGVVPPPAPAVPAQDSSPPPPTAPTVRTATGHESDASGPMTPAPTGPDEAAADPATSGGGSLAGLSFTASSTTARRGRRRASSTSATPEAPALPTRGGTATVADEPTEQTSTSTAPVAPPTSLPVREEAPVASEPTAASPAFVDSPMSDLAPLLPGSDDGPGLPTRRPGAKQAAARSAGLFGSPTGDDGPSPSAPTSTGSSDSSRAALRALSEYQHAQRAVRGADTEESR